MALGVIQRGHKHGRVVAVGPVDGHAEGDAVGIRGDRPLEAQLGAISGILTRTLTVIFKVRLPLVEFLVNPGSDLDFVPTDELL